MYTFAIVGPIENVIIISGYHFFYLFGTVRERETILHVKSYGHGVRKTRSRDRRSQIEHRIKGIPV